MDTILDIKRKRKTSGNLLRHFWIRSVMKMGWFLPRTQSVMKKWKMMLYSLARKSNGLNGSRQWMPSCPNRLPNQSSSSPAMVRRLKNSKAALPKPMRRRFWNSIRHKGFIDVQNALSVGTDSDGGYLVPEEYEKTLVDKLQEENFFRKLGTVIHTSGTERFLL